MGVVCNSKNACLKWLRTVYWLDYDNNKENWLIPCSISCCINKWPKYDVCPFRCTMSWGEVSTELNIDEALVFFSSTFLFCRPRGFTLLSFNYSSADWSSLVTVEDSFFACKNYWVHPTSCGEHENDKSDSGMTINAIFNRLHLKNWWEVLYANKNAWDAIKIQRI